MCNEVCESQVIFQHQEPFHWDIYDRQINKETSCSQSFLKTILNVLSKIQKLDLLNQKMVCWEMVVGSTAKANLLESDTETSYNRRLKWVLSTSFHKVFADQIPKARYFSTWLCDRRHFLKRLCSGIKLKTIWILLSVWY